MSTVVNGRELLDFIETLGTLAWSKYETRYPTISIKGRSASTEDRSDRPPYTSFRFECEDPNLIKRLQEAVRSYQGEVEWLMEGHQRVSFPDTTNWVIYPKKLAEVRQVALDAELTPSQYLAKTDPSFGALAYGDLVGLADHVRNSLRD